jgi:hypothetical protein
VQETGTTLHEVVVAWRPTRCSEPPSLRKMQGWFQPSRHRSRWIVVVNNCGLEFQSPNYRTTSLPRQTNSWKHNGNLKLDKQPQIVQSNPTPESNHWLKRNLPRMFDKCLQNHGDCRKRQSPESIPQSESTLTLLGTSGKYIVPEFFKI